MVYINEEYNNFIREMFDLNDDATREALISVDESARENVLASLSMKFYNDIMNKVDDIDFGTIPDSKGDITKVENYEQMNSCLVTLRGILTEYNQPSTQIDEIETAIGNMIDNTRLFERAFKLKADLPVVIYCTMVLAIVSSISLMITSSIEFIKNPVHENFTIEFHKAGLAKTQNSMLYQNIVKFNKSVKKGEFASTMEGLLEGVTMKKIKEDSDILDFDDESINESFLSGLRTVAGAFTRAAGIEDTGRLSSYTRLLDVRNLYAGLRASKDTTLEILPTPVKIVGFSIIGLIILLFVIRELIFVFYHTRVKVSDYFEAQANILQMNAYTIENNNSLNKTPEQKAAIMKKQLNIAERFRSISNFFAIKSREGEVKTQKQLAKESKYTISDISDVSGESLF